LVARRTLNATVRGPQTNNSISARILETRRQADQATPKVLDVEPELFDIHTNDSAWKDAIGRLGAFKEGSYDVEAQIRQHKATASSSLRKETRPERRNRYPMQLFFCIFEVAPVFSPNSPCTNARPPPVSNLPDNASASSGYSAGAPFQGRTPRVRQTRRGKTKRFRLQWTFSNRPSARPKSASVSDLLDPAANLRAGLQQTIIKFMLLRLAPRSSSPALDQPGRQKTSRVHAMLRKVPDIRSVMPGRMIEQLERR